MNLKNYFKFDKNFRKNLKLFVHPAVVVSIGLSFIAGIAYGTNLNNQVRDISDEIISEIISTSTVIPKPTSTPVVNELEYEFLEQRMKSILDDNRKIKNEYDVHVEKSLRIYESVLNEVNEPINDLRVELNPENLQNITNILGFLEYTINESNNRLLTNQNQISNKLDEIYDIVSMPFSDVDNELIEDKIISIGGLHQEIEFINNDMIHLSGIKKSLFYEYYSDLEITSNIDNNSLDNMFEKFGLLKSMSIIRSLYFIEDPIDHYFHSIRFYGRISESQEIIDSDFYDFEKISNEVNKINNQMIAEYNENEVSSIPIYVLFDTNYSFENQTLGIRVDRTVKDTLIKSHNKAKELGFDIKSILTIEYQDEDNNLGKFYHRTNRIKLYIDTITNTESNNKGYIDNIATTTAHEYGHFIENNLGLFYSEFDEFISEGFSEWFMQNTLEIEDGLDKLDVHKYFKKYTLGEDFFTYMEQKHGQEGVVQFIKQYSGTVSENGSVYESQIIPNYTHKLKTSFEATFGYEFQSFLKEFDMEVQSMALQ